MVAVVLAVGLFTAGLLTAQDTQQVAIRVRLDPGDVVGLDEVTTLEIRILVQGSDIPNIPDPGFELDNFRVVGGPKQSTGLSVVDGKPSASRSLSWQLRPQKTGRAKVYGVGIDIAGKRIRGSNRSVRVVREAPKDRPRQAAGGDPFDRLNPDNPFDGTAGRPDASRRRSRREVEPPRIFLSAKASPTNPYVGQQVVFTLDLFTQVDINSVNPEDFPDFKGFWARVIPQPEQLQPEMVDHDGERFGRVVLIERALFPRRAGRFTIDPISARMVARIPDSGPLGYLPQSREIMRKSNPVTIKVRELPPAPEGFQGIVGEISLDAELEPRELEAGEAATLTLKLAGKGHLQGVSTPLMPEIPGIEIFPPQQQSNEELQGSNVYGSRTWNFVLVPERPGEWELPPIEIPYFNPRRKRYENASSSPIALVVRPATRVAGLMELHGVRTSALPVVDPPWRLASFVPWLFGLPWMIAVVAVALRHRDVLGGTKPDRRHLLAGLDAAAAEERPRQAAARIEDAWREFLHERYEIPQGSPSTRWGSLLVERGVDAETAKSLVKLADELHYLRYAPKLSSIAELRRELDQRSRKLAKTVG